MAPDAEAGKSSTKRADPFAPLTSELLPVGDGHDLYVESVGRADGVPAVYLHGGPGSGCQADHRRLFDPERFHAILFDQRGAGRSRPKSRREDNTLAHLIADMEAIRQKFGFERWIVVGGSWGATLALAYAQAHPDRVAGLVLRATFLGTRAEIETAFTDVLARFYPNLRDDFLSVLPLAERAQPLDAYWRRILDPDPAVHGPAARAWPDTERILSEHASSRVRLDLGIVEFVARAAGHALHGSALFRQRLLYDAEPAAAKKPESSRAFPASSCKAATICCARRRHRMRLARCGAMPRFVSSRAPAIRCTIPACGMP